MIKDCNLQVKEVKKFKFFSIILIQIRENPDLFSKTPFEKGGSVGFLKACEKGNIERAKFFLKTNKYLVFDFDYGI